MKTLAYNIQQVNEEFDNGQDGYIIVDHENMNVTGEMHTQAEAIAIRDEYNAKPQPDQTFDINIGIVASFPAHLRAVIQDRIESALHLALSEITTVDDQHFSMTEYVEAPDEFTQEITTPKFYCEWFGDYVESNRTVTGLGFFSDPENAYEYLHYEYIKALELRETYKVNSGHTVTRIR